MSLLKPQPPTHTNEDILKANLSRIKYIAAESYKKILNIQTTGINMLWNNPRFTPQEIIDALGDDALKIFQVHGILTDAIKDIAAVDGITPEIALPTNSFEVVDGKIVVGEDPYA